VRDYPNNVYQIVANETEKGQMKLVQGGDAD